MDIQATLNIHSELIEQSAAAISIMPSITRDQFFEFISATKRAHSHPATRAVSWIPIVKNELRDEFEKHSSDEGFEHFQITQRSVDGQLIRSEERAEYYPVFYIEPSKGNEPAIGFDLGSDQERLSAISM
ncbi:MAG: CHASE domain-containing protein [Chloroflexi bacterium]|nr:CHASE domain-containing protein [Chloroflexota bacterium]